MALDTEIEIELFEIINRALEYIEDHCHEFVPEDRQSKQVPSLLRKARLLLLRKGLD